MKNISAISLYSSYYIYTKKTRWMGPSPAPNPQTVLGPLLIRPWTCPWPPTTHRYWQPTPTKHPTKPKSCLAYYEAQNWSPICICIIWTLTLYFVLLIDIDDNMYVYEKITIICFTSLKVKQKLITSDTHVQGPKFKKSFKCLAGT